MRVFSGVPDVYYYRTAKVGETLKFRCPTKLVEDVDWDRLETPGSRVKHIYVGNIGIDLFWRDRRFSKMDRNHSHTLVIANVTVNDSAYYRCIEDSGFGKRHFHRLFVTGEFDFCTVSADIVLTVLQ